MEGAWKKEYTSRDYWNLPKTQRAELIDGQLYDMAPSDLNHQRLISQLVRIIGNYIVENNGGCEVIPAPFAVDLNADDKRWLEPDVSVICDRNKLTDRGCKGAPDLIIEVVSLWNRRWDYTTKLTLYSEAGVREYWIVDPVKKCTTVYFFEKDIVPIVYSFEREIAVGIFDNLKINIEELLEYQTKGSIN